MIVSSAIITMPSLSHTSRIAPIMPGTGGMHPVLHSTGSKMIAAIWP